MKVVKITWIDSKGITSEWEFKEDIKPLTPCLCVSIGWLLDDNEEYKTIVQSDSDNQCLGRMTIPACSIKNIEVIQS